MSFSLWKEFYRDAEELLLWMEEKFKIAEDESYRDPTNILRKLKRHEAAEKEMQANQVRLDRLIEVWYIRKCRVQGWLSLQGARGCFRWMTLLFLLKHNTCVIPTSYRSLVRFLTRYRMCLYTNSIKAVTEQNMYCLAIVYSPCTFIMT